MVIAIVAGPAAPAAGLPPNVCSICQADQFSAAFSVRKAISTMPPPITGIRPSRSAPAPLGRRSPRIVPPASIVARANSSASKAIVPITLAGLQPALRITPTPTPTPIAPPA